MSTSGRRNSSRQSSQHMEFSPEEEYYPEEEQKNSPPHNGWIYSIIVGFVGGIIALFASIMLVLLKASLFNEAARLGESIPPEMVNSINSVSLSGRGIYLLVAVVVGMFVGGNVVKRRWAFVAGAVSGGLVQAGLFLVQYIPGYPGVLKTSSTVPWYVGVPFAIFLCLGWAAIGGGVSFFGLWLRRLVGKITSRRLHRDRM